MLCSGRKTCDFLAWYISQRVAPLHGFNCLVAWTLHAYATRCFVPASEPGIFSCCRIGSMWYVLFSLSLSSPLFCFVFWSDGCKHVAGLCDIKYLVMMMAHSSRRGFWGGLMVNCCTLVGGCRDRFLMQKPCCALDRWRFGMRMIGMMLAFPASCVFSFAASRLSARNYNWLFSLMSASCLGLKPPAAMTDGWFLVLVFHIIMKRILWFYDL